MQLLDELMARPTADPSTLLSAAQAYAQLLAGDKLEATLKRLAAALPDSPEAWYDLASVQLAWQGASALESLRTALRLNQQRLTNQPGSRICAWWPPRRALHSFSQLPQFQQLVKTN